jgi:hypothetical protein
MKTCNKCGATYALHLRMTQCMVCGTHLAIPEPAPAEPNVVKPNRLIFPLTPGKRAPRFMELRDSAYKVN